jgi:Fungal specific transcription factor domain
MQQVWEQRRLQRAHGHGDSNFEIVFENEKLEGTKKAKVRPCRHPSDTRPSSGKAKGLKTVTDPKSSPLDISNQAALSFEAKDRRRDGRPDACQGAEDETLLCPSIFPSATQPYNGGASRYGGSAHTFRNSSSSASPHAIGMHLMDPFNSCAVSLGPKESRYMNHYFQALSWRFTMPKRTWLRYAIHDPGLLHGVLAIAAAHYSFATKRELSDDALFHHGKTINHVQKCLKDPQLRFSDGVIGAIGRMVVCHLIYGNRQHFITHTKALQRCAEARGGLESLGMVGQLKYIIASCVAGAATIWWEDVPPGLKYPYGPLDYPAVDDVPDAEAHDPECGSAFRELNKIGFLSDALLDICEALVSLNSVISSRRSWDEPQQRIFGDQCNKLSLRLVYLKEQEISHRPMTSWDHMRFCTHLTVHFYITAFQREVPLLANVSIQTLHELRESLSSTDLENSWGGGQFGELLLWITIITAAGCFGPWERECAGTQLRRCALLLGITDWLEVKRICKRFLFLDSSVEWKTWPLWKDYGPRSEDDLSLISSEASLPSTDEHVADIH